VRETIEMVQDMQETVMYQEICQETTQDFQQAIAEIAQEKEEAVIAGSLEGMTEERAEEHARTVEEKDTVKMKAVWIRVVRNVAETTK